MIEDLNTPLSLEFILDHCASTPEDFREWHLYKEQERIESRKENHRPREYTGYMRYVLENHRQSFVIVARRRRNGTYEIKDFTISEE